VDNFFAEKLPIRPYFHRLKAGLGDNSQIILSSFSLTVSGGYIN